MDIKKAITEFSTRHYKLITIVMALFVAATGALMPLIKVDTDPENMLSAEELVRVFHDETKQRFSLSDIVVLGVVNTTNPEGVFNVESLGHVYELAEYATGLRWDKKDSPGETEGVIEVDMMAPSTVDHIGQGGPGEVKFEWLMKEPPTTEAQAVEIRDKAMSNPLLKGTLVSEDGKAVCLYLPLTSKDLSYRVYSALNKKIAGFKGDDKYHITGLPVAEDTFGVEMFIQMAISAPLAMVVIFVLMLYFFRKLVLIVSPMIVAMVSVISTMGLLIGFGFPVHIMSSMIPIFLMPIAVVDSIHILSEFFDRYNARDGREKAIEEVMENLFVPMLYTSLTSAAGFASLALTPIPPVQVFGVFVAIGIMIAWVFTVTFVPAYVMMISERSLANFGHEAHHGEEGGRLSKALSAMGRFTYSQAKGIVVVMAVLVAIAVWGITRIEINDNPVKWFSKKHPIRVADIELNDHFGGTYMAYLVLDGGEDKGGVRDYAALLNKRLGEKAEQLKDDFAAIGSVATSAGTLIDEKAKDAASKDALLDALAKAASAKVDEAKDRTVSDAWYELADFFEAEKEGLRTFKRPDVLEYIGKLQTYLGKMDVVGKSNSVADIVKKVYQELIDGSPDNYKIPDSSGAVAQCLLQFQSSHNPEDLWHFITWDYSGANIWIQLTSGDNKDMQKVVAAAEKFFEENGPPVKLKHSWAGLTFINTVWQEKMVWGMLQSFMGSFVIVFIMMAILFRSALWGLVSMVPLTITIVLIYGMIGWIGKDYDMPVAVLSALTLGMAVDFAIHFLERARESYRQTGSWQASSSAMFGEPARAITRNVLVIAIGFLPLLAAPLVPYKTVGIFLCAIMGLSGVVTLMVLPALLRLFEKRLFTTVGKTAGVGCNCAVCGAVSVAAVALVALNMHQYWGLGFGKLGLMSVAAVPVLMVLCGIMSRRESCRRANNAVSSGSEKDQGV